MNNRTWVEISASAFNHNIDQLKRLAPCHEVAVTVKSNAYGHGLHQIAMLADAHPGVDWLCTAHSDEALSLRRAGIKKPILNLVYCDPQDLAECIKQHIAVTITDSLALAAIAKVAEELKLKALVHIKMDTGLNRLGVSHEYQDDAFIRAMKHPHISLQGIFTHISDKDNNDQSYTKKQIAFFNSMIAQLRHHGIVVPRTHVLSSGALEFASSNDHHSMIRPGTNIYGLWSSMISQQRIGAQYADFSLQPVMSWKTRIIQIKHLPANTSVGYARTHITSRPTTIAILPVGYFDGYPRGLSNKAQVMIRGTLVPVIGIVSMNLIVIDITDVPQAQINDEVILLGPHPGITATDIATLLGTINIEITTRINPTISRILIT